MIPLQHLLQELCERGMEITTDGERIWIKAPKGVLTPQLLEALRARKPEIRAWLQASRHVPYDQCKQEAPMNEQAALEITAIDGEYCLDSRVLAKRLGYAHHTVTRNIQRHRARLEAKSILRHHVEKRTRGRGRAEAYYLLNERQCLILVGSLKKGEEAEEWHDTLVDAFLQARARVRQLEANQSPPAMAQRPVNDLWYQRKRLFHARTRLNAGYWCIYGELLGMVEHYPVLILNALPDGSVGYWWMEYVRQHPEQFHLSLIKTYEHWYPDKRRKVPANQYPYAWLGAFRLWFDQTYLVKHYPAYLKSRQLAESETEKLQALPGAASPCGVCESFTVNPTPLEREIQL
jgi:phage regulator Rha-like protein